ncbi:hypothetical protein O6H91_08G094300 [Diphasiastrum complanatum]|uniref:Uncharacterized protein n=1 Tax=Diphasiastrum complanatum TaxID=34168 RepID=A0ACC2D020_DIPCM|nr:hypothetical protein O6H91_Y552100 [Diphasiastrum complanatum]KAJ7190393.1 hypothetical protein O6H91_Y527600 [Diphasiastrum complanatum]KAJ7547602.1 hypothetical protein O6H91_08G094300 [Diphasiastrum complanatum]
MASSRKLEGRVAIVTGGSRGIGREIALSLGSYGAAVVVVYQGREDKANEVVNLIHNKSSKAIAVRADVSSEQDVKAVFDKAEETFGKVHILVSSAGILLSSYPSVEDTSLEDWDRIFAVNTKGSFISCREAAKRLVRGGGGRIVNLGTSMVAALYPGYGAYAASKAAVETFTKVLAKELKGRRITANVVAPGPVATEMFFEGKDETTIERFKAQTPLERLGEPSDVSGLVLFLVSDEGEWVNGQVIRANGGLAV